MNKANVGRGVIILLVAGFFSYRYAQLGGAIYLALIALYLGLGVFSILGRLAGRWQNIALNMGISLLFLDLVFAQIDWREFWQVILHANYWWLIPSTLFIALHLFFRTLRWQWLLKPIGNVSFWPAFRALTIGIAGNTVLPARAGEVLRAYVIGRSSGVSAVGAFATIVVERIFDGLTILLVLLAVIIWGVSNEALQRAGIVGAVFYVGALVAMLLVLSKRHWADTLIDKILPANLAGFATRLLDNFISGLGVLKNPRQLGMVLLWNTLTWITTPISFYFALLAFDYGPPIPWTAPVLMLPAMALALTIPGAPGGVGLVQFAVKLTMESTFAGLTVVANFEEIIAVASILIHVSQFAPEVLLGVISFMYEGLSSRDIKAGQQLVATEGLGDVP